jgi:hypothetical protein
LNENNKQGEEKVFSRSFATSNRQWISSHYSLNSC